MANTVLQKQDGVTLWFSGADLSQCINIDIEPGVDTVQFYGAQSRYCYAEYSLKNVKKQFPDVTKLVIMDKRVSGIKVTNMMFPNVKEIIIKTDSSSYESSPYLVETVVSDGVEKRILRNTFCKNEDDVIDLSGITAIDSYAFEGCRAKKIVNCSQVNAIEADAFCGASILSDRSALKEGTLTIENMMIAIDEEAEKVVIPKEATIPIGYFDLSNTNVKEVVFSDFSQAARFHLLYYNGIITINDDTFIPLDKMQSILQKMYCASSFQITDKNKLYCTVDGVVYSKDKKTLIQYPKGRKSGAFEIPEGTEIIYKTAFCGTNITAVKIPDSVYRIMFMAFCNSKIEHIEFNHTLTDFGAFNDTGLFTKCKSLKNVKIPSHVKRLCNNMFERCNLQLEDITLCEGIEYIPDSALQFKSDKISEISFPASLKKIGRCYFSKNIKCVKAEGRTPEGLLNNLLDCSYHTNNSQITGPFVLELRITENHQEYIVYLPTHLSSDKIIELDTFFHNFSPADMDNEYLDTLFEYCPCYAIQYETVFELYKLTGKQIYKDFLKKSKKTIVKRFFDSNREEDLVIFLKLGFFARSSLDNFLKIANEKGMSVLSAYILTEQQKKRPKKSTTLTI